MGGRTTRRLSVFYNPPILTSVRVCACVCVCVCVWVCECVNWLLWRFSPQLVGCVHPVRIGWSHRLLQDQTAQVNVAPSDSILTEWIGIDFEIINAATGGIGLHSELISVSWLSFYEKDITVDWSDLKMSLIRFGWLLFCCCCFCCFHLCFSSSTSTQGKIQRKFNHTNWLKIDWSEI